MNLPHKKIYKNIWGGSNSNVKTHVPNYTTKSHNQSIAAKISKYLWKPLPFSTLIFHFFIVTYIIISNEYYIKTCCINLDLYISFMYKKKCLSIHNINQLTNIGGKNMKIFSEGNRISHFNFSDLFTHLLILFYSFA